MHSMCVCVKERGWFIPACSVSVLILLLCVFITEAVELISTAANHSNAAIKKMVRHQHCTPRHRSCAGWRSLSLHSSSRLLHAASQPYKHKLGKYITELKKIKIIKMIYFVTPEAVQGSTVSYYLLFHYVMTFLRRLVVLYLLCLLEASCTWPMYLKTFGAL